MLTGTEYVRQLLHRWGLRAPIQFLRMYRLHRISFEEILSNTFDVLDKHGARFAFPVVAAVAAMRPDLTRWIEREGHEVASHGYIHIRYPRVSAQERERDLQMSLRTLRQLGVTVRGFRAPYDNYTDDMPQMLERAGLLWDGGLGYRPEHRRRRHFFHVTVGGGPSSVTYIPLSVWSDDRMIDTLKMTPEQVTQRLILEIDSAAAQGGVLMFDLHPIRMGQKRYVGCLEGAVEHAIGRGAWAPTPSEAVLRWRSHGRWPSDASFCLLLTGDIDNWVFSDYLRRQLWRYQMAQGG